MAIRRIQGTQNWLSEHNKALKNGYPNRIRHSKMAIWTYQGTEKWLSEHIEAFKNGYPGKSTNHNSETPRIAIFGCQLVPELLIFEFCMLIKGILQRSANFWYIVELIFVIPKTLFIFLFGSILTPLWASKSVKLRVLVLVGTQKWLSMALKNGYPKDSGHPKLAIRT